MIQALQSMFQLIMQEGWSEVMSEVMCHKDTWLPINFYFIFLHLIASLVGRPHLHRSLKPSRLSVSSNPSRNAYCTSTKEIHSERSLFPCTTLHYALDYFF